MTCIFKQFTITCTLNRNSVLSLQVHTFYEAVGLMIGAQTDQPAQERLIEKYMELPNAVWDSIINQATQVNSRLPWFLMKKKMEKNKVLLIFSSWQTISGKRSDHRDGDSEVKHV